MEIINAMKLLDDSNTEVCNIFEIKEYARVSQEKILGLFVVICIITIFILFSDYSFLLFFLIPFLMFLLVSFFFAKEEWDTMVYLRPKNVTIEKRGGKSIYPYRLLKIVDKGDYFEIRLNLFLLSFWSSEKPFLTVALWQLAHL